MSNSSNSDFCRFCGNEIDPHVCHCGDEIENHAGWDHPAVPMGCTCGYDESDKRQNTNSQKGIVFKWR